MKKRVKTDYANIHIPENKDPREYTVDERRAEEYQMLQQAGTFRVLHTIKLKERYGLKSATSISRDRQILFEYLVDSFNESNTLPDIILKKKWAMEEARKSNDYKLVDQISDSILKMMFDLGVLEKVAEKLKLEGDKVITFEELQEAVRLVEAEEDEETKEAE